MNSIIPDETRPDGGTSRSRTEANAVPQLGLFPMKRWRRVKLVLCQSAITSFYAISKREKLVMAFYMNVVWAGWELGLNIGFGCYGIVIATDSEHYIRWEQPA